MTMRLYTAPMNLVGNYLYRHLLLSCGADFCMSELIRMDDLESEQAKGKCMMLPEDAEKTIIQVGASSVNQIDAAWQCFQSAPEINLNMCCPHSTFIKKRTCGGILTDLDRMKMLCQHHARRQSLAGNPIEASVKLRLGPSLHDIRIHDYLRICNESGIKKVYIHARTLRHPYTKPAIYEPLQQIQSLFPRMDLIISGDIDSYDAARRIASITGCNSVMIGRAALVNPSVFSQIRTRIPARSPQYSPIRNDAGRTDNGNFGVDRQEIIHRFCKLLLCHEPRPDLVRTNLCKLLRGVPGNTEILRHINYAKNTPGMVVAVITALDRYAKMVFK